MRSSGVFLAVACTLATAACSVGPSTEGAEIIGSHRVRASPEAARELVARGGVVIADYGGFQILELPPDALPSALEQPGVELRDHAVRILLNSGDIDTTSPAAAALAAEEPPDRVSPGLHLVQFAGPIRAEWHDALAASGLRIVSYVPFDAYLVYGPAAQLDALSEEIGPRVLQFRAPYTAPLKIDRALAGRDPGAYAVQLVEDPAANGETLALARSLATAEPRVDRALGYVNVVVRTDRAGAEALAARPDVVSVLEWSEPRVNDERQDMVLAGAMSNGVPTGPGYLAWLTARGFTQEQFDASGFGVDVTDSGLDNATDQPEHPGLYRFGDPTAGSRVVYARLEGTPHSGSTLQGCDGHGTLNAHIVGGYVSASSAPFTDPQGFRYGLGVAPFVRLGSSVVFDPSSFTAPDYEDLQSRAYAAGMRISSNSWGARTSSYTPDAQRYDALVRDAQPAGSAAPAPGNQQMVIVFANGNEGPYAGSVGSPATAKNVIAVGAAEGVQAFNGADGCGTGDAGANSAMDVISFSSRGPTSDGRVRPDLMAPGTHISGGVAQAAGQRNQPPTFPLGRALSCFNASGVCGGVAHSLFFPPGQEWYTASSGTSHSTPAVAGAAALLRQWFLNRGLPPPSPAMTKAYLANSARHMTGEGANDPLPSRSQGMGLVDLGAAFDGTPRLLRDQAAEDLFTATGQTRTFTGNVGDAARPFRVTLAWTDAPGATAGAAWVNDLDLTVELNGQLYRGNVFSGATSTTGGAATPRDNLESVFLPAGVTGSFTVRVTAASIAGDGVPGNATPLDQDFALVVWNECGETPPATPEGVSAAPAGDNVISVSWTPVPGATGYQVHRAPSASGPWTLAGDPASPPFLDAGRSGGSTYHYQVRARRDCAASPPAAASATATGSCLLPPTFAGLQGAASTGGITCADFLTWSPATPSCGGTLSYDVFRGVPGFTPGPSNRIATGVVGTSYTDQGDLVSGALYAYVVRAVETSAGGSAADENTVTRVARPYFAGGSFQDDFDGVRPPAPNEWWSERALSGTDSLGIVSGCHYQSPSAAYRFGSSAATCGGSYANSVQNRLVLGGDAAGGFTIPQPGVTLEFRLWYDFETGWDGAVLQYSTAGPDGPWTTIPTGSTASSPFIQTGGYNGTNYALGAAWTARQASDNGALHEVVVNLDALEGRTAWFGWLFHTDSSVVREGLYLDDVVLNGTGAACSTTPVPPGTPSLLRITGLPSTARADDLLTVTILALDQFNQPATSYAGTAALTSDDPQAVLPATATFTDGVATAQIRFRTIGRRNVTAVDTSVSALRGTGGTQITAGPAAALSFQVQPQATTAGTTLGPAPAVSVRDAYGNATTEAPAVTLALAPNGASAVLRGTTTTTAYSGLATFTSVYVERAGTGYRLVATSPGLTSAQSEPFTVAAGAVQKIAISSLPTTVRSGQFFSPPLVVQLQDPYGNPTRASGSVSLRVSSGPADGHVLGQTTIWATDGVASFGGVWLDVVGTYRILADGTGLGTATSASIAVTAGDPHHARFSAAPSVGQAAVPFEAPFTATLHDQYGNVCTAASSPDLTLYFAGGSVNAALLGETTVRPVNGVATFGRVGFDRPGAFRVYVGSPDLEGDFTSTIVVQQGPVIGYHLSGPSSAAAGQSITIRAEARDAYGRFAPYLGTAWILTTDPAAEVPEDEITFSNGASGSIPVVLRTAGTQRIVVRDAAGNGVEGSLVVEVTEGEPPPEPGGGGGGCGSGGAAGAGSLVAAGLWLARLRRRRGS